MPSADGRATDHGRGSVSTSRQEGPGEASTRRSVRRAPARRDASSTRVGSRQRHHGQRMAGPYPTGRARRSGGRVLTAPDNGLGRFTQAGDRHDGANGSWSAQLPAGPSRLVEAYYAGASTLEPSVSAQVHVIVPAKVKLISVVSAARGVGRDGADHRPAGRRVSAAGRRAGAVADRAGARTRPMVCRSTSSGTDGSRLRTSSGLATRGVPQLLVPDRDVADGRLCLRAGCVGAPIRGWLAGTRRCCSIGIGIGIRLTKACEAPMIARRRGDERIHSRWRPAAASATAPPPREHAAPSSPGRAIGDGPPDARPAGRPDGDRAWGLTAIVVVIAVAA